MDFSSISIILLGSTFGLILRIFIQNNYNLVPVGYNEEWWAQEMIAEGCRSDNNDIQTVQSLVETVPSEQEAIKLSKKYNVALHPKYIPAWKYLTIDEIRLLKKELWKSKHVDSKIKYILEKAFILHTVEDESLSIKYLTNSGLTLPTVTSPPYLPKSTLKILFLFLVKEGVSCFVFLVLGLIDFLITFFFFLDLETFFVLAFFLTFFFFIMLIT